MITLTVNGNDHTLDEDPDMPLLWALRDVLGLTGTKYGCGIAQCGACTVYLDGEVVPSCITPLSAAQNRQVVTIEGLKSDVAQAAQSTWEKMNVVQCGFCQSGQIMTAAKLLSDNPRPSDQDINEAMSRVLCRCNTYLRIRNAIRKTAMELDKGGSK